MKLNYTPALLCISTHVYTLAHAPSAGITVAVANELWREEPVACAGEYPGMCCGPGGPLLEKIRLDNATAQSRGAAGRIKTGDAMSVKDDTVQSPKKNSGVTRDIKCAVPDLHGRFF